MKTHFRPWLAVVLCFSPSLAALGQSISIIIGAAHAPRSMYLSLPTDPNNKTSATFATGPVTDDLHVDLVRTLDPLYEQRQLSAREAALFLTLEAVQDERQIPIEVTILTEKNRFARLNVYRGVPCRFTVSAKPGTPPAVAAQYRFRVQTLRSHEPEPTVSLLWFFSLLVAIPGSALYNRQKKASR